MGDDGKGWYAVRCVFLSGQRPGVGGRNYEERVTLWRARTQLQAIRQAEAEARSYAAATKDAPDRFLGVSGVFQLFDDPAHGAEVFSQIRTSRLPADRFLDRFFEARIAEQGDPDVEQGDLLDAFLADVDGPALAADILELLADEELPDDGVKNFITNLVELVLDLGADRATLFDGLKSGAKQELTFDELRDRLGAPQLGD